MRQPNRGEIIDARRIDHCFYTGLEKSTPECVWALVCVYLCVCVQCARIDLVIKIEAKTRKEGKKENICVHGLIYLSACTKTRKFQWTNGQKL